MKRHPDQPQPGIMVRDNQLVHAYIAALDLAAIYVRTGARRTRIGRGNDPGATLKRLRKASPDADLVVVGWCRAERAEILMMNLRDEMMDRPGNAAEAARRVLVAAERLGVTLQSHAELLAIASAAVQHVERTFETMLRAGKLRDLNRRYRAERLAGKSSLPYARWLDHQKLALARTVAGIAGS